MTITADDIAPLTDRVYAGNGGGCCLHIMLEDGNLTDEDVAWCLNRAVEKRHPICYAVALLYREVPEVARDEMRGDAWGASFDLDANEGALADVARLERERDELAMRLRITTGLLEGKSPTV